MKIIKVFTTIIAYLILLVGCKANDGLDRYRDNGQLIDLSYETFDEKINNKDDFVFFLKRNDCSSCEEFYPLLGEFLDENPELKIYSLNYSELNGIDALTLSAYYVEVLGKDYYENNGYSTTTLYSPTITKVMNGEFVLTNIGVIDKTELIKFYQDNFLVLNTYYSFSRKVSKKHSFNLFVSLNSDSNYENMLRNYYLLSPSKSGYYLDCSSFTDSDLTKLLNRINYFLGEDNKLNDISDLPSYFMLKYSEGVIIDYQEERYMESSLDVLYGNQ